MTNSELLDLLLRAREVILRFGKTEEDHNLRDRIDAALAEREADFRRERDDAVLAAIVARGG